MKLQVQADFCILVQLNLSFGSHLGVLVLRAVLGVRWFLVFWGQRVRLDGFRISGYAHERGRRLISSLRLLLEVIETCCKHSSKRGAFEVAEHWEYVLGCMLSFQICFVEVDLLWKRNFVACMPKAEISNLHNLKPHDRGVRRKTNPDVDQKSAES